VIKIPESKSNETAKAIQGLKNNRTGQIKLKNGRIAVDTGTNTHYTTLIAEEAEGNEAVAGNENRELKKAKDAESHTGSIYIQNGNIYASGYGTITLID